MVKALAWTLGTVMVLTLCSCAHTRSEKQQEVDLAPLEKQIQEANEKIDKIYHQVSMLQFMVDNHQRTIQDLEKKSGGPTLPAPETVAPESPDTSQASETDEALDTTPDSLYQEARSVYQQKDYLKAGELFDSFAARYPQHDLADNALYWVGECHYARKDFKTAIGAFKSVVKKYPDGNKIPDALLKIGFSYYSIGDKENARAFLTKTIKRYPFSPAATKAEKKLGQF